MSAPGSSRSRSTSAAVSSRRAASWRTFRPPTKQALAEGAPAIVLTGKGRCFSAGIDVKLTPTYTPEQRRAAIRAINTMVSVISAPVPVVAAAVNGRAMGGGLALACDMRLASCGEHALALNEVAAGVPFPAGPLALVHGELAPNVAREMCLTGCALTPAEAREKGVVDQLVEGDALLGRARALAWQLASHSAYAIVKRQVRGRLSEELERICAEDDDPLLHAGGGG